MSTLTNVIVSAISGATVAGLVSFVSFVELQPTSPGVAQSGNVNVTGQVIAGGVKVGNGPAGGTIAVDRPSTGNAVYARSQGTGVFGQSLATAGSGYGGYFVSNSAGGRAVFGDSQGTGGNAIGGQFQAKSASGIGVQGRATSATGSTIGVQGSVTSSNGIAVQGNGGSGTGVNGNSITGVGGQFFGPTAIAAETFSSSGTAIKARNSSVNGGKAIEVSQGEVVKDYGAGNRRMVPIAYGSVGFDANIPQFFLTSSTGNVTLTMNGNDARLAVANETLDTANYTTVVTCSEGPFIPYVSDLAGQIVVRLYQSNGSQVRSTFQFVIFKGTPVQ